MNGEFFNGQYIIDCRLMALLNYFRQYEKEDLNPDEDINSGYECTYVNVHTYVVWQRVYLVLSEEERDAWKEAYWDDQADELARDLYDNEDIHDSVLYRVDWDGWISDQSTNSDINGLLHPRVGKVEECEGLHQSYAIFRIE
jgi:hypothetical protein